MGFNGVPNTDVFYGPLADTEHWAPSQTKVGKFCHHLDPNPPHELPNCPPLRDLLRDWHLACGSTRGPFPSPGRKSHSFWSVEKNSFLQVLHCLTSYGGFLMAGGTPTIQSSWTDWYWNNGDDWGSLMTWLFQPLQGSALLELLWLEWVSQQFFIACGCVWNGVYPWKYLL